MVFSTDTKRGDTLGLLPPPPGVTPNFEHPVQDVDAIIVSNLVLIVPSTLIFFLRIYTRRVVVKSLDFGDYAVAVGWLLSVGYMATCIFWTKHGLGIHGWDMSVSGYTLFSISAIIASAFYSMSTLSVKLSILAFYLQMSPFQKFRVCVYIIALFSIGYSFAQLLEFTYSCRPIAKGWDLSITTGSCSNALEICVTNSAANAVADFVMLMLPIVMLWGVRMRTREKVGVIAILMSGSLVCIVSVIRLKVYVDVFFDYDSLWLRPKIILWNIVEIHTGVICACLPHMKPLIRRYFPKAFASNSTEDTPMQLPSLKYLEDHDVVQENMTKKK